MHCSLLAFCTFAPVYLHTDVQVEQPDAKLTSEELHSLQTVNKDDLVWIEIGVTGVGKSTLGNFLLGKHVFEVGGALVSVTDKAQVGCSVLDRHCMCIVDTPGFGDTHRMGTQNAEAENLAKYAAHLIVELSKTMLMARHGVHAFFVVVRADSRELFSTKKLLDLLDILGNYWDHTILVFTHGKEFDKESEDKQYEKFEAALNNPDFPEVWKTLVEKVSKRYVIVEPEDWKDDKEYHARKVKELKEHSSAIVAAHGPYNDTLHSLLKEYIETAKLELHNEFEDMGSPKAEVAALQVAFQNITAMLHKLIRIKLAGEVDTELLQEMAKTKEEELSEVRRQRDQLYQQLLKEQEERRRAQEAEDRAREAQRVAEEQAMVAREAEEKARVAREAEEKARKELEKYLKKPPFEERVVETRVSSGNFHNWEWVHSAEAVDVATGITANARNYRTKDGAKKHARINLKAILLDRGIIRKEIK